MPDEIHRLHRFVDAFSKAVKSYEPEAYQGRVTCFLNDEYSHDHKLRRNNKRRIDDWYDLAVGGLDVRLVPGDTFTMWREPHHVQILAEQLKASLDEAQADIGVQGTQSTPKNAADAETGQNALATPRVSNQ
jgi:hypothetical protein